MLATNLNERDRPFVVHSTGQQELFKRKKHESIQAHAARSPLSHTRKS